MWHNINQFIVKVLPYLPLFLVWKIAKRYVAGQNTEEALRIVQVLNAKGFSVTLDILGEHTKDVETSEKITENYQSLLLEILNKDLDCNLSIKPSHIGVDVSDECIVENIESLIQAAKKYDNFIRIDMEDSSLTDKTIDLYRKYNNDHQCIGLVLQAYLFRTKDDLEKLIHLEANLNFRLCKGIYRENPDIAFQDRQDINNNFIKLLEIAFRNDIYVGIATHDLSLIEQAYDIIDKFKITKNRFEFQVLYGVPMGGWLEKHLKHGYKVRIYAPFGKDWYKYSIRRLKENPNIAGYVMRDIFRI